jgi:diguanylate cyclase (GGDEF)-like protein
VCAGVFALVAAALPALDRPRLSGHTWLMAICGVAALAVASSVELEIGSAAAVPTEPVLIALLFLVPPSLVPVIVLAGLAAGAMLIRRRTGRRESWLVTAASGFHSVGPAVVALLVTHPAAPDRRFVVLLGAIVAQFVCELGVSWLHNCLGLRVGFRELWVMLRWTAVFDVALAPSGLLCVVALGNTPLALALALFPVALVAALAGDRVQQIDRLVALGSAYDEAHEHARHDALTSLGNRLAWNEAIQDVRSLQGGSVAIVIADVDRLKVVNDRYGHDAGDRLLRTVGAVLKAESPPGGLVCRIGGDEFGVMLFDAMASAHRSVAEAIAAGVEARPAIGDVPMSVSVGHATGDATSVIDTIQLADDALYSAKRLSRERAKRTTERGMDNSLRG